MPFFPPFLILCVYADAAVPPWVGYSEEETIQQQILALSAVSSSLIIADHI